MKRCIYSLMLVYSSLFIYLGLAQAASVQPGDYVIEGGGGHLNIQSPKGKNFPFSIMVVGPNLHTCDVEGNIKNNHAVLEGLETDRACTIKFLPIADGIKVIAEYTDCRGYCGMRAWFGGNYILPSPQCRPSNIEKTQVQFSKLYRNKAYAEALSKLTPLISECSKTLHWMDDGAIRNDIAISQFHLGRLDECKKTLEPVLVHAYEDEDQLRENLPPGDFDTFLPIAKAAWYNKKLCDGTAVQKH